jgi:hypothetical protein
MDWTPIVVGAVVVIAVVALVLFRKKAKLEVQLPLGVKTTFEGSNEEPGGAKVHPAHRPHPAGADRLRRARPCRSPPPALNTARLSPTGFGGSSPQTKRATSS